MSEPLVSAPSLAADERAAELLEELVGRMQAGESVDVEAFLAEHPAQAGQLRRLLPAARALAEVSRSGPDGSRQDSSEGIPSAGVLGDFRIIREVGRGGMGVVYEAEQASLRRRVALKVLPFAAAMDPRRLQRFQNEALAAAQLHHTNIVPVFAVGCERGLPFYAMQFIDGRTLADVIQELRRPSSPLSPRGRGVGDEGEPAVAAMPTTAHVPAGAIAGASTAPAARQSTLSAGPGRGREYFRRVAEWGVQAAEALDYAHQAGVVHRDVKPANLMLDGRGHLWVTDFGLAQMQSAEAGLTMTGDLVGTLRYMSPEQALAKRVPIDHRTDVYSLGATLYELLTLRPAFEGKDRQELLRQIAFEEPKPPRRVDRKIPAELEVIVLKALEKNPADRYGTAQELADDLRLFLDDKPIRARRPTAVQRLRKWGRRHRVVVASAVSALLLVLLASLVSTLLIAGAYTAESKQRLAAEQERDTTHHHLYTALVQQARQHWENGDLVAAAEVLDGLAPQPGQTDLRGWEWNYLRALCHRDLLTIQVKYNQTGPFPFWQTALSPDGRRLCTTDQRGELDVWDAPTGEQVVHLRSPPTATCLAKKVAWSPDGRRLSALFMNGILEVWDAGTWRTAPFGSPSPGIVSDFAWSPDGQRLATWEIEKDSPDFTLLVWEAGKYQPIITAHEKGPWCNGLLWSPNGRWLASSAAGGGVIWDAATGEAVLRTPLAFVQCWGADGQRVVVSGGEMAVFGDKVTTELPVQVWDVANRQAITLSGLLGGMTEAAWQPNGSLLALGRHNGDLLLWDVGKNHLFAIAGHKGRISAVAWDPEGKLVASSGEDRLIKLWNPETLTEVRAFRGHTSQVKRLDWSPDGKRPLSTTDGGDDMSVKVWDAATGQDALPCENADLAVEQLAWASDQLLLGVGPPTGGKAGNPAEYRVAAWDATTGRVVPAPQGGMAQAVVDRAAACQEVNGVFSADGRLMAQAHSPRMTGPGRQSLAITIHYANDRQFRSPICTCSCEGTWASMAFSPDSSRLATICVVERQYTIRIWNASSGNQLLAIQLPGWGFEGAECLAWSRDGRRIASAPGPGTARDLITLWDTATGQAVLTLGGHSPSGAGVISLTWSPNGQQLASLVGGPGLEHRIELWDASKRVLWEPSEQRAGEANKSEPP